MEKSFRKAIFVEHHFRNLQVKFHFRVVFHICFLALSPFYSRLDKDDLNKILLKENSKFGYPQFRNKWPVLVEFFRIKKPLPMYLGNDKISI